MEVHKQGHPRVVVRRYLLAAAIQHLAVDLQNILGSGRDFGYNTLDLTREESRQVVLDYCWQSMVEGERRCTELGHALAVGLQQPNRCRGRVRDQDGDVGAL